MTPKAVAEHVAMIAHPLGWFFAVSAAVNGVAAWRSWRRKRKHALCRNGPWGAWHKRCLSPFPWPAAWLAVSVVFAMLAWTAFRGQPATLPEAVKRAINGMLSPAAVVIGGLILVAIAYLARSWLVRPAVAWAGLNLSLLFLGLSVCDPIFARTVLAPDNVPIVAMVYLLGFFTWLAAAQAVENDRRGVAGQPPREAEDAQRVFVWPDLVYSELIAAVTLLGLLLAWSLLVPAPLEQPANAAITPNPSKAPWYFLGLQELLSYGDAWLAGVAAALPGDPWAAHASIPGRQSGGMRLLRNPPPPRSLPSFPGHPLALDSLDPYWHLLARPELGVFRHLWVLRLVSRQGCPPIDQLPLKTID